MSYGLVVPGDDSQPIAVRKLSEAKPVAEQAQGMVGGLVEVVSAPGLHEFAPELWPVLLVDENGHGKGLPLNRRAGELYGAAIAGDALICQERRGTFWVPELSGFTEAEAEQLRELLLSRLDRRAG